MHFLWLFACQSTPLSAELPRLSWLSILGRTGLSVSIVFGSAVSWVDKALGLLEFPVSQATFIIYLSSKKNTEITPPKHLRTSAFMHYLKYGIRDDVLRASLSLKGTH